jgi:hypothetical protein
VKLEWKFFGQSLCLSGIPERRVAKNRSAIVGSEIKSLMSLVNFEIEFKLFIRENVIRDKDIVK